MENVRSSKTILKYLRRSGKTLLTSHAGWRKNSGVRSSDRAVHEHAILSRALEYATSYDQMNICNLASMEVLVKRRMLLEAAYEGRPEAPVWTGSEHFMGFKDHDDGVFVDQAARAHQSRKLKEDATMLKELRLKREEDAARSSGPAKK
jgi:hypothetical protein